MKAYLMLAAGLLVIGAVVYGGWKVGRVLNYNLNYKEMVRETVRDMVKESSLK